MGINKKLIDCWTRCQWSVSQGQGVHKALIIYRSRVSIEGIHWPSTVDAVYSAHVKTQQQKTISQLCTWWPGLQIAARLEVILQTSLLLSFKYKLVSIRTTLHDKSRGVFIKPRWPAASLPFKGQIPQQTTVKYFPCMLSFNSLLVIKGRTYC